MSLLKQKRFALRLAQQLELLLLNRSQDNRVLYGPHYLRQSQVEANAETSRFFKQRITGGHIIQPGGTGKLHEMVMVSEACFKAGGTTLIIAPDIKAVKDTVARFRMLSPEINVGAVYEDEKVFDQPVTVMTYASFLIALKLGKIDPEKYSLLLADEGHHFLTELSDETLDHFTNAVKIAFTATPRYYAGKELAASRHFGQLFYNLTLKEAIERRECTPTKARLVDTNILLEDYERLFAEGGQPSEDSILYERAINQAPWNHTFVDLYRTYIDEETGHRIMGDKAFVFCAGIQHAKDMAVQFNNILMPYINGRMKYSEEGYDIREALEAKGINPARVRFACAPIWGAMDREGGWPENGRRFYTQDQLMGMFADGEILTLSNDKILAESIDIPAVVTVLNAVPTGSFVRAGQRGMRTARLFSGDAGSGTPAKDWAYVFDGLPANWQRSIAAPVLFSDFVLKDLYTMHGAEPPLKNGEVQPAVPEMNLGYRVIWDIETLLSINAFMEAKRSIPKAEVVPAEFLNDSLAIKILKEEQKDYPNSSNRLIGYLYKDWEAAYEEVGRPAVGVVQRYNYAIPAEHFRFANNRLYIHRASLSVIWRERQDLKTIREMRATMRAMGHGTGVDNLEKFCELWLGYLNGHVSLDPASLNYNYYLAGSSEKIIDAISKVKEGDIRQYEDFYYIATPMAEVLAQITYNSIGHLEQIDKIRERRREWVNMVTLIDPLADMGFTGLGRRELIEHLYAAAQAARNGMPYGDELFLPTDFFFKKSGSNEYSHELPTDIRDVASAHVRRYRLEQFIEALEIFHDADAKEPDRFPAPFAECYAAIRRISRGNISHKSFNGSLKAFLAINSAQNRRSSVQFVPGVTAIDFISPDGTILGTHMSQNAFESLKHYLAGPPAHFVALPRPSYPRRNNRSNFVSHFVWNHLKKFALNELGFTNIAGISIAKISLWTRDPIGGSNGDKLFNNDNLYVDPALLTKLGRLFGASEIVSTEVVQAFSMNKDAESVTVRGCQIPRPINYAKSEALCFLAIDDRISERVLRAYLQENETASADASAFPDDGRLASRISLPPQAARVLGGSFGEPSSLRALLSFPNRPHSNKFQ